MIEKSIESHRLANNSKEYQDLIASGAPWVARTENDLSELRAKGLHGLDKLSETNFAEFIAGLEFAEGGIAGGNYKMLMTLSLSEIFEIFNRLGMSDSYARQTQENRCGSNGCEYDFFSFCSSLCTASATDN